MPCETLCTCLCVGIARLAAAAHLHLMRLQHASNLHQAMATQRAADTANTAAVLAAAAQSVAAKEDGAMAESGECLFVVAHCSWAEGLASECVCVCVCAIPSSCLLPALAILELGVSMVLSVACSLRMYPMLLFLLMLQPVIPSLLLYTQAWAQPVVHHQNTCLKQHQAAIIVDPGLISMSSTNGAVLIFLVYIKR